MPISTVSTGQPVKASTINDLISQANKVPSSFTAGANIAFSARLATPSTTASSYTKLVEVRVPGGGALRVVFSLAASVLFVTAYARIYRNGGAVGTARSMTSTTPVQYSEDLSGWTAGDLLQIYAYSSSVSDYIYISGLTVRIDETPIEFVEV